MSLEFYLAYVAACIVIVIVPGPTVTLIVANSLRYGTSAGLLNVAGTQLGIGVMMMIVAVGLASLMATMSIWFDWVRLAGAAYLVWLGIKMFRASGSLETTDKAARPRVGFFLQGFLVLMSNPKVLLLFGAFIPQFVDPRGDYVGQVILLGVTAMVTAAIFDSIYAVLAGRAGQVLPQSRVRILSKISGMFLIGGGIWMALARTK